MKNRKEVGFNTSQSGKVPLIPPCTTNEVDHWPEIKRCCELFNHLFHRNNIEVIMRSMKYALDVSRPWITQKHSDNERSELAFSKDFFNLLRRGKHNVFSKEEKHEGLLGWRY